MGHDGSCVALGLKVWKTQIDRADKLFGSLSSEEVLREIAPGRNRLLYLWGHLTAIHDAMLPLLGLRERLHPELDVAFVSNPDKSRADIPSHEQVRRAWNVVNAELLKGFEAMSWSDWFQRHAAVSEGDFAGRRVTSARITVITNSPPSRRKTGKGVSSCCRTMFAAASAMSAGSRAAGRATPRHTLLVQP
jgi:hypothetical protein